MESFDDLYAWLSDVARSNYDPTVRIPRPETIISRSRPYLKIMGVAIDFDEFEKVRGLKSKVFLAKDEDGKTIFRHSTVANHTSQLARNVLRTLAGLGPDAMQKNRRW
jgi:hypothetical protein